MKKRTMILAGIAFAGERITIMKSRHSNSSGNGRKEAHMCKGCGCLRGKATTTVVKHDHEHSHGDLTHSHPHDHDHDHTHDEKKAPVHEDHKH